MEPPPESEETCPGCSHPFIAHDITFHIDKDGRLETTHAKAYCREQFCICAAEIDFPEILRERIEAVLTDYGKFYDPEQRRFTD